MLKSVLKVYEEPAAEKKISLEYDFSSIDKRNIYMDSYSLKTIFKNILETSISMTETGFVYAKAENPNEEICTKFGLNPEKAESYLYIAIADSGVGIAEDEMRYLCEPYAQLEKGKKNFMRALKLGSATILIKRSEGLFNVNSEVMKGTTFEIILPIKEKDEQGNT
jgi:signal transduction histidine kinase